jgi:hypothetical protein
MYQTACQGWFGGSRLRLPPALRRAEHFDGRAEVRSVPRPIQVSCAQASNIADE